jgi:Family of unknown function (DUF6152)
MRTTILCAAIVTMGLIVSSGDVLAHHAFSSEFDANRHVVFTGTVTKMMWVNPHAWIYVDVKKPDGTTEEWMVEAGTPNTLLRRGFTKNSLLPGTEILVDGYQAKDGSLRANGRDLTLPDGKKLFLGSSGTGAPDDGKDPTESKK